MSLFGCVINTLVFFAKLPEVSQVVALDVNEVVSIKGLFKKYHTIFGFLAEFAYVGAQVAVASFAIFYVTEQRGISPAYDAATASNMFSGMQGVFTAGRFFGVFYLRYVDPSFALFINGLGLIIFTILTAVLPGKGALTRRDRTDVSRHRMPIHHLLVRISLLPGHLLDRHSRSRLLRKARCRFDRRRCLRWCRMACHDWSRCRCRGNAHGVLYPFGTLPHLRC